MLMMLMMLMTLMPLVLAVVVRECATLSSPVVVMVVGMGISFI